MDAELNSLLAYTAGDFVPDGVLQDRLFSYIHEEGYTHIQKKVGCNSCIGRAYAALHRIARKKKLEPMKKYRIKKGVRYRPPNWDIVLSEETCTDELAEKAIERNPSALLYFDVIEEKATKPKAERKKSSRTKTKKEVKDGDQGGKVEDTTKTQG